MRIRPAFLLAPALIILFAAAASAQDKPQEKKIKVGLTKEDWKYTMAEGVTTRETFFYSDGVRCYARLFYPKGFSNAGKTPGIVLAHGWAAVHFSIDKYGARFAERGLVAMVIDYSGWGLSDGFISTADRDGTSDENRFTRKSAEVVIKRTRLIPLKQVEDIRNAISWLQGEAGVDPERIGIWGSSFAGGNVMVTAAKDARVKAVVAQVPAISGKNSAPGPVPMSARAQEDAVKRARTGQGAEFETGFSTRRMVDLETNQMVAEYRPFHYVKDVGSRPVLFIVAEKEELFKNSDNAGAAMELLTGPKKLIVVPGVTHFEMYINEAFEISSNAAAGWFRTHLGMEQSKDTTSR